MGVTRIIRGLRAAGWNNTEIYNYLLYTTTGEERYRPGKSRELKVRWKEPCVEPRSM